MYESFLIGLAGAFLGSLVTGRSYKGALAEKSALTYDLTMKVHEAVRQVKVKQEDIETKISNQFTLVGGQIGKLGEVIKAIAEDNDKREIISELEIETEEQKEKIVVLSNELEKTKQLYVEMATKANEEITKLQGALTTYHNALLEASKRGEEMNALLKGR